MEIGNRPAKAIGPLVLPGGGYNATVARDAASTVTLPFIAESAPSIV